MIWAVGIILITSVLFYRTVGYKYIIDDSVKRDGYLYELPNVTPPPEFYNTKPSAWYRVFIIGMHAVNSIMVGGLFGWPAGLLFAVHPVGVVCTAWVTGNYYATTAYFVLIALYFLNTLTWWGTVISTAIFAVSLNTTLIGISVPFIFLFSGPLSGIAWALALPPFLFGKRFRTGVRLRADRREKLSPGIRQFTFRRISVMVKTMAFYIGWCLWPVKVCFFRQWGECYQRNWGDGRVRMEKFDLHFWASLTLCVVFFYFGSLFSLFGTVWFFITMAAFSNYVLLGQFIAERYTYLPLIGVAAIVGKLLAIYPLALAIVVTLLFVRSWTYVRAFKDIRSFWRWELDNNPDYPMAYSNYAQCIIFDSEDGLMEAWSLLRKAEVMSSKYFEIFANLAVVYILRRMGNHALAYCERALEMAEGRIAPEILTVVRENRDSLLKNMPPDAVRVKVYTDELKVARV